MTVPIWAPEVSARFARALLDEADRRLGSDTVADLLAPLGVARAELDDETGWLSLAFCELLCERVVEKAGSTEILVQAGRAGFSPRVLGFLYALVRALSNTEALFARIAQVAPTVNKVARMTIRERSRGRIVIEYRPLDGAPREKTRLMCTLRGAQLAAIPTVFGLPEARLIEHECHALGAEQCLYEFRWLPARRSVGLLAGLAVGVGAGLAAHWLGHAGLGPALAVATSLGGAIGALVDSRREIVRRGRYLEEQNAALAASAEATERRFAEVVEAKRAVDQKVEERTRELNQALAELREVSRAKNDFFANVSHELRTPLTLILAPLEAMLEEPARASPDALTTMHKNAVRLLRLINELLDLAKVDAGGMRIRPVPTELGALARQVTSPFEPLAAERGIALQVNAPGELPLVPLDPDRIDIALSNLVANALKFTPRGGRVTVEVRKDGADAVVDVSDTGTGISPEDQPRVFERFAQASQGPRRAGGTGIGLALVSEIASLHGGKVGVSSEPGQGTTFTIRLALEADRIPTASLERRLAAVPVQVVRRQTDLDPWSSLVGSAGALAELQADSPLTETEERATAPEGASTVLVVEDHDELRRFVTRSLSGRYRVIQASDGEEALARIGERKPDLVVSDVMMPRMDGYELCRRLKADVATRPIPVLLLTAKTGVDRLLEGFAAGADDYIAKPFNEKELLARVEVHLRLRGLMQEVGQRERLAVLGLVAAGVAHEVRNPLAAIQGVLPRVTRTLAAAGQLDDRTAEVLATVGDAVGRIDRVTRDLLDLSRIDRETVGVWRPGEALEAAVRLLGARNDTHAKLTISAGVPAEVAGRPAELNQVVLNVIDNALRAAGESGEVSIGSRIESDRCVIEVADSGPGIAPEVLPRIFEPFFTTRLGGQGTGLGLAIARQIVNEHLGSIHVECPEGGGTVVRIALPVKSGQGIQSPSTP